jgi:hypothetical protein
MIRVNDDFEFERDTYGWKLHQWSDGVNPKTKEPIRSKSTTYHPNLEQVCSAVIDRCAGLAECAVMLTDGLASIKKELHVSIQCARKDSKEETGKFVDLCDTLDNTCLGNGMDDYVSLGKAQYMALINYANEIRGE